MKTWRYGPAGRHLNVRCVDMCSIHFDCTWICMLFVTSYYAIEIPLACFFFLYLFLIFSCRALWFSWYIIQNLILDKSNKFLQFWTTATGVLRPWKVGINSPCEKLWQQAIILHICVAYLFIRVRHQVWFRLLPVDNYS